MRKAMVVTAMALAASAAQAQAPRQEPTPQQVQAIVGGLHPQKGDVAIPAAGATLHLGQDFYFLAPAEAKRVLVDLWGNPPEVASDVLGLVMPAGKAVTDDSWGAVVTYENSGYVTDDDAQSADYDDILKDLRDGTEARNEERRQQGYPAMHVVGWAQAPSYDRATHAVVWARDLKLDSSPTDALNYDVRVLGRQGVLSLNMLWDMPHLGEVRQAAATFARTAQFDAGQAYADFSEARGDKRAGYGLAGLVAAGVGVAAAKKLGFLALALGFGKKFLVLFAVAGAAVARFFRKLFGRGGDGDATA